MRWRFALLKINCSKILAFKGRLSFSNLSINLNAENFHQLLNKIIWTQNGDLFAFFFDKQKKEPRTSFISFIFLNQHIFLNFSINLNS